MEKAQTLKGFRDINPEEALKRGRVLALLKSVFKSYGFQPLETPTLEYASVLEGKYGAAADKLIYKFKDRGGRDAALRYDLTVPL
ncbi:MAG: ATP phosphoribosyltransferase regulatory subunit, partial [Patescibacteria group bacterium]